VKGIQIWKKEINFLSSLTDDAIVAVVVAAVAAAATVTSITTNSREQTR
jgi:hypothetical protein